MPPAHERLEGVDRAVRERDDRLILDDELTVFDRALQLEREASLTAHSRVELWLVDDPAAALITLGRVHGDIGVSNQLLGRLGVGAGHGDPDARMELRLAAVEAERCFQSLAQPLRRMLGLFCVCVLEQHGELVAPEPRRHVRGTHRAADPRGDLDKKLVACRVTPAVVDVLEAVEVEEEDRVRAPGTRMRQGLRDAICEQHAVRKAGERVVVGLMAELFLQLGDLGEGVFEAPVLEQDAGMTRECPEQLSVGLRERADVSHSVADQKESEHALFSAKRADDRVVE